MVLRSNFALLLIMQFASLISSLINIISLLLTSFNSAVTLKLKCGKVVCAEFFIFMGSLLGRIQGDRKPVSFLTLASFAIEAMYYKCGIKLDSISDPNLYHIINRNIRGGFCSVGRKHVIANNKDTNPNFDSKSMKSNYLLYIDFNSLYPSVMSKFKLPMGDFVELNGEELNNFKNQDITNIDI